MEDEAIAEPEVTVATYDAVSPSGILLVLDPAILGRWRLGSEDQQPDGDTHQTLTITGPDAEQVAAIARARSMFRQHAGLWIYDLPETAVRDVHRDFARLITAMSLDATLIPSPWVPYPERARRAAERGGDVFFVGGASAVALPVSGSPVAVTTSAASTDEGTDDGEPSPRPGLDVMVDSGIVVVIDLDTAATWTDWESIDGLCDIQVTGPSAAKAAVKFGLEPIPVGGVGWPDLADAESVPYDELLQWAKHRRVEVTVLTHSHDYWLGRVVTASPDGIAALAIDDAIVTGVAVDSGRWWCTVVPSLRDIPQAIDVRR